MGRYLDPLYGKDDDGFPVIIRDRVGLRSSKEGYSVSRLPSFTSDEVEYISGTLDFLGLNHYTTFIVKDVEEAPFDETNSSNDLKVALTQKRNWSKAKSPWLKVSEGVVATSASGLILSPPVALTSSASYCQCHSLLSSILFGLYFFLLPPFRLVYCLLVLLSFLCRLFLLQATSILAP